MGATRRDKGHLRTLGALTATVVALCASPASAAPAAADGWPQVEIPNGVRAFDVGQRVILNGTPMRMTGFVSSLPARQVADAFKRSLGKPLVENSLGNKLILGRGEGEHYVVVQIEPTPSGSRGAVAVSQVKAALDHRAETHAETERWLGRLPAGTRIVSEMASEDRGKLSRHLVASNGLEPAANRDRLVSELAGEGLAFERETVLDADTLPSQRRFLSDGRMLFFKGRGKEAIATLHRDESGQTMIVLNVVTTLEQLR